MKKVGTAITGGKVEMPTLESIIEAGKLMDEAYVPLPRYVWINGEMHRVWGFMRKGMKRIRRNANQ